MPQKRAVKAVATAKGAPSQNRGGVVRSGNVPAAMAAKRQDNIEADHVVQSREFIFNVSGNSAPYLLLGLSGNFPGYDLNPANRVMFPWLSQVASAYEKYRFESLSFEIVPRNPTSASGAVYAAVDYDWDDNPATTTAELMSNRGAVSGDVWTPMVLNVDIRRLNEDVPWRYIADFPRSENSQRMVYAGFFMIAIAGTASTVSFDVFARYKVRLSLPALHAIDASSTYTFPAAKVLPAATYAFPDSLPVITGIANLVAGVSGVPPMVGGGIPAGAGANVPVYKLGTASKGELNLTAQVGTTGSPPSAWVTDSLLDGQLHDSAGNFLASVSTANVASVMQMFMGPDASATWATNGALGRAVYTLSLAAVRRLWPTAAYLLPFLYSSAGRTLSTSSKLTARYTEI